MPEARRPPREWAALLFLLAFAGLLLTIRLSVYPAPWLDEGYKLNAVRTLAERGVYGTYTVRGFQAFDPGISTGPTTIVPVALAYRWFGAGMLQVRLVIVAYALLAILAFHALARRMYGSRAALLVTLALIAAPEVERAGFIALGRQVLGEEPAVAMVLCGFLFLDDHRRSRRRATGLLAGLCFGLGFLAKVPVAIYVLPALAAAGIARHLLLREDWSSGLLPPAVALAVVAGWQGVERWWQARDAGDEYATILADGVRSTLVSFHVGEQLDGAGWALCGLLAVAVLSAVWRRRSALSSGDDDRIAWLELTIAGAVAAAMVWFVVLSIGWPRYIFVPLVLSLLLLGAIVRDLGDTVARRWPAADGPLHAIAAVALALLALSIQGGGALRSPVDGETQAMATYIRDHVPAEAVIETWEWELDALSGHWQFSHPHQRYLFEAIRQQGTAVQPHIRGYALLAADPDFLVRGRFSDWTHIYDSIEPDFEPVTEIGLYRLYRRVRSGTAKP